MNRTALNILYGETASVMGFGVTELDVAELLAALGEDLEAGVDAEHVELVVGGLFAEEIDGGGAGDLGLGGHRELFRGGRGPLLGRERRRRREWSSQRKTAERRERRKRQRPEMFMIASGPLLLQTVAGNGLLNYLVSFFLLRFFLLFFEDGVSLLVGCDDAGQFLEVGVFVRGKGDLADGVGGGCSGGCCP